VIIPLGEGGHPDQGLPGGGDGRPPGIWGGGNAGYPDQGLPGQPPGVWPNPPEHPGNRPPGSYPGRPDQGLPGRPPGVWPGQRPPRPDQGLPPELGIDDIGPSHPWVPPAGEEIPPPPQEIADQVVVAVWRPDEQAWRVAVAQGPHPVPHG
jgi:hypothetical protein